MRPRLARLGAQQERLTGLAEIRERGHESLSLEARVIQEKGAPAGRPLFLIFTEIPGPRHVRTSASTSFVRSISDSCHPR